MTQYFSFRLLFICSFLFFYLATCAYGGKKLIFLTEEWNPFNFKSKEKDVDGFTTTIVEKIADNLGEKISVSIHPWSRSYNTVLHTKNHAIFSIYKTKERKPRFKWVGPVYKIDTVLWGLKNRELSINKLEDAKKYRIIVQKDSAYEQFLTEEGFIDLRYNASRTDALMIIHGRGDLVPLCSLSLDKLKNASINAGKPYQRWKAYATLFSKKLYIAFNIKTPDNVIRRWQNALDDLRKSPFFKKTESKFIKPILNQTN